MLCSACILMAGCSRKSTEQSSGAEANVTYLANGWSQGERDQYYHLAEGSELMPYALLANLKSTTTGKPFLEGMERFGFLPDRTGPTNPHGLPVGVTVSRSRNAGTAGIEIIGFNCAACHVGELTYQGKRVRIDGAPATVNLQQYQVEFKESLDATLRSPEKLLALVIAIERQENTSDTPSAQEAGRYAGEPEVQSAGSVQAASERGSLLPFRSLGCGGRGAAAAARKLPRAPQG